LNRGGGRSKEHKEKKTHLGDDAVEGGVGRAVHAQVAAANVVDGLVVDHEGAVGVLHAAVRGEDGVVGLDHCGGDLRRWVDGELELALLAEFQLELFHEQGGEAGAGAAAERVEDEEALQSGAVVGQKSETVHHRFQESLAHGVVPTRVVVRRVLLAGDQLLGMEEVLVLAMLDLV
jgi:hypothetical protein